MTSLRTDERENERDSDLGPREGMRENDEAKWLKTENNNKLAKVFNTINMMRTDAFVYDGVWKWGAEVDKYRDLRHQRYDNGTQKPVPDTKNYEFLKAFCDLSTS